MILDAFKSVTHKIKSEDIKAVMQGFPTDKSGTVKSWFSDKKGKNMLALSVDVNPEGEVVNAWMPPARIVDEVRSTYATLNGSRIDLSGKVLAANDNYIIFETPWGDNKKVFGYRVF